jgi:hypothetical protein
MENNKNFFEQINEEIKEPSKNVQIYRELVSGIIKNDNSDEDEEIVYEKTYIPEPFRRDKK